MFRNAVLAMLACLVLAYLALAVFDTFGFVIVALLPVGVIAACTTMILEEITALRRELRGETRGAQEPPTKE